VIRQQRKGKDRHPARTWLIRAGNVIIVTSGFYLLCGIAGLVPLATEAIAWNNLRILASASILGCLISAIGYGDE